MNTAARLGANLASVEVEGKNVTLARGGKGATLLYLHGLCDAHSAYAEGWTPFLEELSAAFEVLAPALPGYNGSHGPDGFDDVEDYAWHVVDLLDVLGLDDVLVVGHSLGAWIAAETALRHPGRFDRMVLVDPLGLHVSGLSIPALFDAVAPRGTGRFDQARSIFFADPDSEVALDALPDSMDRDRQLVWYGGLVGAAGLGWKAPHFQSRKLARRIRRIEVPTKVLVGELDVLVPPQSVQGWAGIPGSAVEVLEGAAHSSVLEVPSSATRIADFLMAT
jgi:pimeloyl-ACP methyl ester carboxylesterase